MAQTLTVRPPGGRQAGLEIGSYPIRHRNPECVKHGFRGRIIEILGGSTAVIQWDELKGGRVVEVGEGKLAYTLSGTDRLPLSQIEMALISTVVVLLGARAIQPSTLARMLKLAEMQAIALLVTHQGPLASAADALSRREGVPVERCQPDGILDRAVEISRVGDQAIAVVGMKGGTHAESKAIATEAVAQHWETQFFEPEALLGEISVQSRTEVEWTRGHYIGAGGPGIPKGPLSNPHCRASNRADLFNEKELLPQIANKTGRIFEQVNVLAMTVADGQSCRLICDCQPGGQHVCHGGHLALAIQQKAIVML